MQRYLRFLIVFLVLLSLLAAIHAEWEYEAVYKIDEVNVTYSINLANNADAMMVRNNILNPYPFIILYSEFLHTYTEGLLCEN